MNQDDRAAFMANAREKSIALGEDEAVFNASTDLLVALDRYDYSYLWTWMGVPIIQMPADVMATQEAIWAGKPDIIVECGVARGGSVLMLAGLLRMIGNGRVIGVDIDIRKHNQESIEAHPLSEAVTLISGSSADPETLEQVKAEIPAGARVMVILDSDHSYAHVLRELELFAPLVTEGCYLVVADTLLGRLTDEQTPRKRSQVLHAGDEPLAAVTAYMKTTARFELDPVINGKLVLSSSPGGYFRCVAG